MFSPAPTLIKSVQPRNSRAQECGVNVARLLAGAWHENHVSSSEFQVSRSRNQDPKTKDLNLSEPELDKITSLLCRLGAGALGWYKIRNTPLAKTFAGEQLHEVYRRQRLSALLHERDLVEVLTLFRAEGIDAILVKGWAIARRYPDPALRSYGDLDLCVAPAQFAKAQAILKRIQTLKGPFVDLHSGFGKIGVGKKLDLSRLRKWFGARDKELDGNNWDELYARSQVVMLEAQSKVQSSKSQDQSGFPVRILSDEDHLRILCLHLLRSGARRPAWLCDVALLVEEVSSFKFQVSNSGTCSKAETLNLKVETRFNWEVCLGRNPIHAAWVGIAVTLAHELLGADISQTPSAGTRPPRWIVDAVLGQWDGKAVQGPPSEVQSRRTRHALWALDFGPWANAYGRWDNPIRATAAAGGNFTNRSLLRYRVAELVSRIPEAPDQVRAFARQLRSTAKPSHRFQ